MINTLKVKKGVKTEGMKAPMEAPLLIYALYCQSVGVQGVITDCMREPGDVFSLHETGYAIDLRARDLSREQCVELRHIFRAVLTADYQSIWYPDSKHFHIEYDRAKFNNREYVLKMLKESE